MLERLGFWVVKYRLLVIIAWVVMLFPALYGAVHLHEVLQGEASSAPGTEMYQQEMVISQNFPEQNIYSIQLVLGSERYTVDDPIYEKLLNRYLDIISKDEFSAEPVTHYQDPSQVSSDRKKTFVFIGLHGRDINEADTAAVNLSKELKAVSPPEGIDMYLTGGPLFSREITTVSAKDGFNTEKRILPLILIVLILAFGGVIAAGLPLVVGLFSTILSLGVLYLVAQNFPLTSLSQNIVSMLGLGVGIDYSLLFVNRYREELYERGLGTKEAAIASVVASGRTIIYSGTVVSIGLMALLVPNVLFMRSLGLSGLMVVAMTVLVSLTLLPAILSYLGEAISYPKFFSDWTRKTWGKGEFWYRWAKYIMSRPLFFSVVSIGMLFSLSLFTFELNVWSPTIQIMPESMETRKGYEEILEISPQNMFAPIIFSFETQDGSPIWLPENMNQIYHFMQVIKHLEPIRSSIGLINMNEPMEDQMVLYNTIAASGGLQNLKLFQPGFSLPFISADESKGILAAFHEHEGFELTDRDLQTIEEVRDYRDHVAGRYPNIKIMVGGLSSIPLDMKTAIFDNFLKIILFTVIVTYLLTMFSFGSLILPLKAVVLNVLSVTATYGMMILVFQKGLFAAQIGIETVPGALMIVSPLILFCVIFGLSMDYEIFLINRIQEEYERCGDPEEAIALGLQKTGGIITSAGLIMIMIFLGFAFARLIVIKEFGFGLAVAIFIDATIIRLMVVPALMKLFGHAAWYFPKSLDIPFIRKWLKE